MSNAIDDAITPIKTWRNLIKKTQCSFGYIHERDGEIVTTSTLNSNQDFFTNEYFKLKQGETVWYSSYTTGANTNIHAGVFIHIYNMDKTWMKQVNAQPNVNVNARVSYTATEDCYVRFSARGYYAYNHKAEYGIEPTPWSLAPEDVDSAIDNKIDNNQETIFNRLFANGEQGFVLENNRVYINGEVIKANAISGEAIKAGTLDAGKITVGQLQSSNGKSVLNLNNGAMLLGSAHDNNYLEWTGSALNIRANSLTIGLNQVATSNDVNSAINGLQVGSKNILRYSGNFGTSIDYNY